MGAQRFLLPGQWWFGHAMHGAAQVATVLGSCVAVTLWHARARYAGMCHFLLPRRDPVPPALDGRYGEEALALLWRAARAVGTAPAEYDIGVYGGANMFAGNADVVSDIGALNSGHVLDVLQHEGLRPVRIQVGGGEHRFVSMNLINGRVSVRTGAVRGSPGPDQAARERA